MKLMPRELINEIKEVLDDNKAFFGGEEELKVVIIDTKDNRHIIPM